MRRIIQESVDILGLDFIEAKDGQEAIDILSEGASEVSLILLDWNMPNLNGYEVLVKLKENDAWKEIPVMMVTTEGEKSNIVKAIQAGAKHYVTKPFNNEDLAQKMLECLGMA